MYKRVNYIQSEQDTTSQKGTIIWSYYLLKLMEETKMHLHVSVLRTNRVQTRLQSWNG